MTTNQTQLYFRTWQAAAMALGWTTKAGIAAELAAHHSGQVWESPALNRSLATIYELAQFAAQNVGRDVTADDLRHACTAVAIGRQKSSKSFTNAEFDRVLALLRMLAEPTNLNHLIAVQSNGEDGERRRLVHSVSSAPPSYWQRISRDRFGHIDLDRLTLVQLRQLSLTLRNRRPATRVESNLNPQLAAA